MVAQPDQIAFIVADLERYTRAEIVRLAVNVDANLRESPPGGTPVDTGWAKANWLPSITAPNLMGAAQRDPTPGQVSARAQLAEQGRANVLAWKPADGPIFITNNVPYIGALNGGHSPQSPPGFVQKAMEKAVRETYSSGASKAARGRRAEAGRANKARPK